MHDLSQARTLGTGTTYRNIPDSYAFLSSQPVLPIDLQALSGEIDEVKGWERLQYSCFNALVL